MDTLKRYFEKQYNEKSGSDFCIFSALHNITDERQLHSRFIAYLLSSKSQHGVGNKFLQSFMKLVLGEIEFDCDDCTVKTEYKDIDIFIYNNKQAVIIENKIYAGDQPRQLERYCQIIKNERKGKEIFIVYLTLDGRLPSTDSLGETLKYEDIICCDYTKKINEWLSDCIAISERENYMLSQVISQYKTLITELTSDLGIVGENQCEISRSIHEAWRLEAESDFFTEKYNAIFKHVKWQTVADFINELEEALNEKGADVIVKPDLDSITKVTHNNSNRAKLIIRFIYNECDLQIVNDAKGFTLGSLTDWKWSYFSGEVKDIKFHDFSKKEAFYLINKEERNNLIEKIVNEVDSIYKNLAYDFRNVAE